MSEVIHNVVYTSRSTRSVTAAELDSILQDARKFNADHDITGVLFYAQGRFFQFLEGSAESLILVMDRIRAANCHDDIDVILDQAGLERHFADWHMAFTETPESELQALSNATWDNSIPLTRTGMEKSPSLALVLSCWSRWGAGYFDARPSIGEPLADC